MDLLVPLAIMDLRGTQEQLEKTAHLDPQALPEKKVPLVELVPKDQLVLMVPPVQLDQMVLMVQTGLQDLRVSTVQLVPQGPKDRMAR